MTSYRYERPAVASDGDDSLALIGREITPGTRVLDLGIGSGALGAYLRDRGCTVDGVDVDEESVVRAREVYRTVTRADLDSTPPSTLFDGRYEFVVCADVLEHLKSPERLLSDVSSLLADDGRIVISVPNVTYLGAMIELLGGTLDYRDLGLFDRTHLRFFSRANLEELLRSCGLHPVQWSRVIRPLNSTEFAKTSPGFLPRSTLEFLETQPEALTYQFVVSASTRPESSQGPEAPVPARAASPKTVRLYWRTSNQREYADSQTAIAQAPLLSNHSTFVLPFSSPEPIRSLRIDPGDDPGVFTIHNLRVKRPGAADWVWPDASGTALVPRHDVVRLPSPIPALYLSSGADPQLELDLAGIDGPVVSGQVEVSMTWWLGTPWDLVQRLLESQQLRDSLDGHARAQHEAVAKVESRLGQLEKLAEAQRDAARNLERRLETSSREARFTLEKMDERFERSAREASSALQTMDGRVESGLRLIDHRLRSLSEPALARLRQRLGRGAREFADSVQHAAGVNRGEVRLRLEPAPSVEPRGAGEWFARDEDPQFVLHAQRPLPSGEHLLSATLDGVNLSPTLYFDFGHGFVPGAEVRLPQPQSGRLKATVYIPRGTVRLRLDPAERTGAFTLRAVTLSPSDAAPSSPRRRFGRGPASPLEAATQDYPRWRSLYVELDARQVSWFAAHSVALQRFAPDVLVDAEEGCEEEITRLLASLGQQRFVTPSICFVTSSSRWTEQRIRQLTGEAELRYATTRGGREALLRAAAELARSAHLLLPGRAELLPHTLAAVAATLSRSPGAELVYWDEEIARAWGTVEPLLKPAWSPSLLEGHNYIGDSFVLARTTASELLGSSIPGKELTHGVLLAIARSPRSSETCRHVPAVLGRRPTADSSADVRPARTVAMARRSLSVRPLVSIIVPTRDRLELLHKCLESVKTKTAYESYELLVVDNRSEEPATLAYLEALRSQDRIRVLRDERPFNFAELNNSAVEASSGELVCLMNNDVEVGSGDWLGELVLLLQQRGVGAVGPMLLYPDGTVQHAGVVTGMHGVAAHLHRGASPESPENNERLLHTCEVSALTAACLLLPRALYLSVGGMNTANLAVAFNDVDLCLKLRQRGRRLLWTPQVRLIHHESVTRGSDDRPEHRARLGGEIGYMLRTWGRELGRDPYFNPNLSLESAQPVRLAFPPHAELVWPLSNDRGVE